MIHIVAIIYKKQRRFSTLNSILVVDDEPEITDLIELYMTNENYTVHKFYSGKDAVKFIDENEPDLAILDIMLPDVNGFKICQHIRE